MPTRPIACNLPRTGHLGGAVRYAFLETVERLPSGWDLDRLDPALQQTLVRLTGTLWGCTDVLRREYADLLDLPPGSSYAQAARRLRAWLNGV